MHVYVHIHVHIHVHMHVYVHIYVHIHIYMYKKSKQNEKKRAWCSEARVAERGASSPKGLVCILEPVDPEHAAKRALEAEQV